jgi:hypothetical protein
MYHVVSGKYAFPGAVITGMEKYKMISERGYKPAVGNLHQKVVFPIQVADLREDIRGFGYVSRGLESVDEEMWLRMAEIVELYVQTRPFP